MPNDQTGTVLLLDDELMIAKSLEALLQLETSFDIITFARPDQALAELDRRDVDVVLSDYMMPGMDGITFLRKVREKQPFSSRILLTGYADKGNAIRAINEANLFHYLEKPWDNEQLKIVIRNGVERAQLLRNLDARVAELEHVHGELRDLRHKLIRTFL